MISLLFPGFLFLLFLLFLLSTSSLRLAPSLFSRKREKFTDPCYVPLNIVVEKSSVLNFAPWLELHHIVFLAPNKNKNIDVDVDTDSKEKSKGVGVYAIDFTPIDQSNPITILKLLFAFTVPAEVRIRYLGDNAKVEDVEEIRKEWSCMNMLIGSSAEKSQEASDLYLEQQHQDEELKLVKKTIERIKMKWGVRMNMYTHNCQHFSAFCRDFIKREEVCPIS